MSKNTLFFMPLLAAAVFIGCTQSEPVSDEDFLESVRAGAEKASGPAYESHTALEAGGQAPDIESETDHVFIYDVPYDQTGEKRIKLYNRGQAALEVANVSTSCTCTVGRVEQKSVPPGGSTDLIITIYPQKIPGFEATRVLTVTSNDPNDPDIPVVVTSYVQPELELVPESMNIGALEAGKGYERHYVVRQLIDEPLEIESARTTQKYIDVTYELRPEEQWKQPGHREYDLTLHVRPDAPVGRLDSRLALHVNLERVNRLMFDLSGVVHRAPYTAVPRTSVFSRVAPGSTLENAFTITSDAPITVTSVESESDTLELIHRQGDGPGEVAFDIVVGPEVAEPRVTQLWDVGIEVAGESYTEQLATRVDTNVTIPESE